MLLSIFSVSIVEAMSGSTHPVCQSLVLGNIILGFDSLTCWMAYGRVRQPFSSRQAIAQLRGASSNAVASERICAHLCTNRYLMSGADAVNAYMYQ